jgi:hypothetical protein
MAISGKITPSGAILFLLMLLAGVTPASKERLAFTGANQDTKE